MAKILKAWRQQSIGRYAHGTNFKKGDYIPTSTNYFAKIAGGAIVELSAELLRSFLGVKRITDNRLNEAVGKESNLFQKK